MRNKGFTLIEILIVVVIAVSVVAFSVPAYKKTQEKANYNAALGVLMQLGGAVETLRNDLQLDGLPYSFPASASLSIKMVRGYNTVDSTIHNTATLSNLGGNNQKLAKALISRSYMPELPLDSNDKFKGFYFYVCPAKGTISCCGETRPEAVACMSNDLIKAYYLKGGTTERSSY